MSIDATRWAWQQILRPSEKLVLLSMADRAGETHECWPSISRLESDTCLDRKTVMMAIKELESKKLLRVERDKGIGNKYQLLNVLSRNEAASTKNGTSHKTGTSTKNGTPTCPKNGTTTSTKNGTLNLSIESTIESTNKHTSGNAKNDTQSDDLGDREKPENRVKKNKTRIAEDFSITGKVLDWYAKNNYQEDIQLHFSAFFDKCQAKGYVYVDWDAAFKNAIRDDWAGLRKQKSLNAPTKTHSGFKKQQVNYDRENGKPKVNSGFAEKYASLGKATA